LHVDGSNIVECSDIDTRVCTKHNQVRLSSGSYYPYFPRQPKSEGTTLPERFKDEYLGPASQFNKPLGAPG
jgi:hypothetical protein